MKMILTIVEDSLSGEVSKKLLESNFRVTRLASTGGLLREGATTLMVGVSADQVEEALNLIRDQVPLSEDPKDPHATIFVLNVKDFKRV